MPDFRAQFSGGTTFGVWNDPPSLDGTRPSRLNTFPQRPHRRRVGTSGVQISVTAIVGISVGPLDSALGGRLFVGWLAECPAPTPPAVTSPPGQSSVIRFTPEAPGHYTVILKRAGSGAVILHVDVSEPS